MKKLKLYFYPSPFIVFLVLLAVVITSVYIFPVYSMSSQKEEERKEEDPNLVREPIQFKPRAEVRIFNSDGNELHELTDSAVVRLELDSALGRMRVMICDVPKPTEPKTRVYVSEEDITMLLAMPGRYKRPTLKDFKMLYGVYDNFVSNMDYVYRDIFAEIAKMSDKDVFLCHKTTKAIIDNISDFGFVQAVETLHRLQEYNMIVVPKSHTSMMITLENVIAVISNEPRYLVDEYKVQAPLPDKRFSNCETKKCLLFPHQPNLSTQFELMMRQIDPLVLVIIAAIVAFVCISSSAPTMVVSSPVQAVQITQVQGSPIGQCVVAVMAFVLIAAIANLSSAHNRR
jgi:hypothetical protein